MDKPRNWVEQLSKTMKLLREIKGMGQREHARHLGLKISTLNRIEAGKPCDVDTLVYIHEKTVAKIARPRHSPDCELTIYGQDVCIDCTCDATEEAVPWFCNDCDTPVTCQRRGCPHEVTQSDAGADNG